MKNKHLSIQQAIACLQVMRHQVLQVSTIGVGKRTRKGQLICLMYREFREAIEDLSLWIEPIVLQRIVQNLWTGKVLTPLVDIQLVQQ